MINRWFVLAHVVPHSTLVTHQNMAAGVAAGASYVSAAIIAGAAVSGAVIDLRDDLLSSLLYFLVRRPRR